MDVAAVLVAVGGGPDSVAGVGLGVARNTSHYKSLVQRQ